MATIAHLFTLIRALTADRARLALQNAALRQQLIVLKRSANRAKINDSDRVLWVLMRRMLNRFRGLLIRWERIAENYLGMLQLASGIIAY